MSSKYLLLFVLIFEFSSAQTENLKGVLYDARTKTPIANASIQIEKTFQQTRSLDDGSFNLQGVVSGNNLMVITKEGYQPKKLPFSKKYGQTIDFKTIYLEPDVKELQHENTVTLTENDFIDDVDADFSSGMLQATRDLFLTRSAFDFSQSFFKVKGYDSKYGDLMINGLPMNRMFNGRPQWNNWGGLNDVFRNQEYFDGLEANPYTFGGILGTTNISSNPAGMRPGLRLSSSFSNRTYAGRLMATYNSGLSTSGFSYSLSASRRWAEEGYVDGTVYDAYSVFASLGYQINKKHNLFVTAFYTPNRRGKSAPITEEVFELVGRKYNSYWGEQNDAIRNSRIRKIEEPIAMFNYDFSGDEFFLKVGAAYQFGTFASSRLGYYDAPSPNPDYYRYLPSFYINNSLGANFENANLAEEGFKNDPQLQWTSLYQANSSEVKNGKSSYVLYDDTTDENQFILNFSSSYALNPYFKLDAGARAKLSSSENYGLLIDLLGSDFHEDLDPFSNTRNDASGDLNKVVNDRMGYNYEMTSSWYEGFFQANLELEKLSFFSAVQISQTKYQRNGLFLNERFPLTSKGKSEQLSFTNYGLKSGFTYKFNNRHVVSAMATYLTDAPTLQNSFVNARENNKVVDSLESTTIYSGTLTYHLRLPKITAKLTGYYTKFEDDTDINYFYVDAGVGSDFVQEVVTDISKRHLGGELGFTYQATSEIKLTAVAAYGDFRYIDNANVTINFDTVGAEDELINLIGELDLGKAAIKDYRLATGPQKAYSVGVEYRSRKYWWIGMTANYMDDNYVDISAIKRTESFLQNPDGGSFPNATDEEVDKLLRQEKLTPVYLLNLTAGKSWLIKKKYVSLFGSFNNLFDVTYRTGGFEQSRNANFGQAYNDDLRGAPLFGNKYWYGYGRTFFLNLAVNF
ncbi:carboxypeptidase-like regulatory domain-containing protein [Galbibacter sp. BG1]|uniref:carboxypeptidase-like regulatory domain-containing protein n=1 Tax=Galbibacter sp. BG1 TaxID=1170699 RepID=UPI0015BED1EC|nr:carboxypeptidase-like regulatory domain-containing protein [Galbibacter sp. BG1]QLE01376.1 carboxypeptidase-like regulatory domain-containing protein [Galbibacter sp. BG1]